MILTLDVRLVSVLCNHFERPVLDSLLNGGIVHLSPDQTLDIKNGAARIYYGECLSCLSNQPSTIVVDGDIGWSSAIAMIVGDYLGPQILKNADSDARVCSTKVNTDGSTADYLPL